MTVFHRDNYQWFSPLQIMLINESVKTLCSLLSLLGVVVCINWSLRCAPLNRPVLSLVKQKTPIILPGFQSVSVSDELSGQYSVSWRSSIAHYLLLFVLLVMAHLVSFRVKVPSWRPGSAGFHCLRGRRTRCLETLPSWRTIAPRNRQEPFL